MSDDWRDFGEHEWDRIRAYAADLLHQREEIGRRSYGSGLLGGQFRGDPITHLENEIGDLRDWEQRVAELGIDVF